ncbi:uncharacterized protein SPPG_01862 [Spizellomyces punctatus DAOM BR117]|uniref:Kinesin-like protein n=1 Tax=Spizellomyces punctatus (strain DAOM BR117) TaxID=645134 RepID=A0A0L0HMY5_SPIPD|nr:uncharacterized protein SPPG_01862 [Spizellomyces punctatus DAOM BR117]KND02781.1 hypothetical protein SPPG_01862 [Spizellomyces punctatus DAOM BR117]|eukprot:XP_016610820.1 hypothetical protein SPPG_01862 [Spizellomyces punctatus DAOM BR117]
MAKQHQVDLSPDGAVRVFVRWRPLTKIEISQNSAAVSYEVKEEDEASYVVDVTGKVNNRLRKWSGGGFAGVLRDKDDNASTFAATVEPILLRVMEGGTGSCFCYGHTGSGKTHTVLGYGEEFGLYYRAATRVAEMLKAINHKEGTDLAINVRFSELYNGKVYDLLKQRAECHVRQDADGKVHIRSQTEKFADGRVRVRPLHAVTCRDAEEVAKAVVMGTGLRTAGVSTLHDQSSRSHAIIEMEIVTKEVMEAREAVLQAESELVPVGKRCTDIKIEEQSKMYVNVDGEWKITGVQIDQARIDAAEAELKVFEERVKAAEERAERASRNGGHPCVGGTLVFVDLAGAEHGADEGKMPGRSQTAQERREGRQINTELLALKEVIRARAQSLCNGAQGQRIPFRTCSLTMVLRRYLIANDCACVMIANTSPSVEHTVKTINTLQYAALVTASSSKAKKNNVTSG